ncbi:hypothetical protein D3C77_575010 [compost metagenome]
MTWPTIPSKLSMKLLIQRPISPASSLPRRVLSRRWRKLPSPSARVRISSVISCMRAANRAGPKRAKEPAPSNTRAASSASKASGGRPLKCCKALRMKNSASAVAR